MHSLLYDIADRLGAGGDAAERKGLGKLPVEVLDMIVSQAEWLMTREEAEEYRLELMNERSTMVEVNDELMFAPLFYMCEH